MALCMLTRRRDNAVVDITGKPRHSDFYHPLHFQGRRHRPPHLILAQRCIRCNMESYEFRRAPVAEGKVFVEEVKCYLRSDIPPDARCLGPSIFHVTQA